MRIYIIGNDGITLCREPPAAVNEGEIVVASNEELHAARLSGKRLLALWNALPDVEKRKKVGDRDALIDQLWSAIEALPDPDQLRHEAPVEAGRGDCDAAPTRGRNRRRSRERDGLAAAHGARPLFGNPEEEARAHPCLGPRGARPGLPHCRCRRRHEPRDPRCNGLPGGALAPPHARPRRTSSAVACSLQNRGIAASQPRAAGASCRIPDAGSRSWRAAPGAAAPAPPNCTAVQANRSSRPRLVAPS